MKRRDINVGSGTDDSYLQDLPEIDTVEARNEVSESGLLYSRRK